MMRLNLRSVCLLAFALGVAPVAAQSPSGSKSSTGTVLRLRGNQAAGTIAVYRQGGQDPILTQNALPDNRPYLHPIVAPDGKGVLTEYRPVHHLHQTGVYWGLKQVNGRDYFMKWQSDYWRRVSAVILQAEGLQVKWRTVYDMLDENGAVLMTETQTWSMAETGGRYVLDLEWKGEAKADVTLGKFYVGGLFVRMPWRQGTRAEIVTEAGDRNMAAEQRRAKWIDLGDQVEGREDMAHIAVFDHPQNYDFPVPWRVDSQMGFGPNRNSSERRIGKGTTEVFRHRLIAYGGPLDPAEMTRAWDEYAAAK